MSRAPGQAILLHSTGMNYDGAHAGAPPYLTVVPLGAQRQDRGAGDA